MTFENLNEIRDKIFQEIKELISELVPIESAEELGEKYEKIKSLYERTIFLKKLYEEGVFSKQNEDDESSIFGWRSFSSVLMDLHGYEDTTISEKKDLDNSNLVVEEVNEVSTKSNEKVNFDEDSEQKIKLEHIKDVKSTSVYKEEKTIDKENKKNIFNLDLNDRITFLKTLFSGDEVEMTITLNKLYNAKTLLEANKYLSEVYHDKNWSSVDEYAQRLWSLVERRFQ